MIDLSCPHCGGLLKCNPLDFVEYNNVFIYTNVIDYTCEYCKSKFTRNQQFTSITNVQSANTIVNNVSFDQRNQKVNKQINVTGRSVTIRGSVENSFISTGNNIIVRINND